MASATLNGTNPTGLKGLILTGGQSRRMGQDKSQLVYHQKPQRDHLVDLLRPYCQAVFWSVNADQAAALTSGTQPFIVDALAIRSPLNGILSAFRHDSSVAWLVVACDMPLLTSRSLEALLTNRDPTRLATVFYDSTGRAPEPLLGIYEPAFAPVADRAVADGQLSPRQILQSQPVQLLTVPDVRELTNVNDPVARHALGR
ncbi:molybdopterin-guanine dinucleotide biosynthesis protein A [Spirosoma lacussanchae]|uniref:NTP transferase domain-containing protein n=1 Tax=Spirosoma lacussanchae TaxID=1884249 RepID=UPI001FE3B223|nr:NTP transferase domain-containing protein [Spirosoma lacussanchae]